MRISTQETPGRESALDEGGDRGVPTFIRFVRESHCIPGIQYIAICNWNDIITISFSRIQPRATRAVARGAGFKQAPERARRYDVRACGIP